MSEDAAVLFPGKTVIVMGEEILVEPFSFVTIMVKASKLARSFAGSLKAASSGSTLGDVVLDIMADGGEDILKLVQLAVPGKPSEWWNKLPPDDGVALTAAVLEVNRDFFTQRLQEPLKKLTEAIGAPLPPPSSAPVIPGQPSSVTP
jgi:hypothetical protein